MRRTKGFTLIELLTVVALIGILASVILVATGQSRRRARDAKRKSDVNTMATALENSYAVKGRYPSGGTGTTYYTCGDIGGGEGTPDNQEPYALYYALVKGGFIQKLPSDPISRITKSQTNCPGLIDVPGGGQLINPDNQYIYLSGVVFYRSGSKLGICGADGWGTYTGLVLDRLPSGKPSYQQSYGFFVRLENEEDTSAKEVKPFLALTHIDPGLPDKTSAQYLNLFKPYRSNNSPGELPSCSTGDPNTYYKSQYWTSQIKKTQ